MIALLIAMTLVRWSVDSWEISRRSPPSPSLADPTLCTSSFTTIGTISGTTLCTSSITGTYTCEGRPSYASADNSKFLVSVLLQYLFAWGGGIREEPGTYHRVSSPTLVR